jgi:hypothetical protein
LVDLGTALAQGTLKGGDSNSLETASERAEAYERGAYLETEHRCAETASGGRIGVMRRGGGLSVANNKNGRG